MDFWKAQSQNLWWTCRARSPAHEHDRRASDTVDVEGSPGEYVDYVKVLQEKDPTCLEENAVAYPRPFFEISSVAVAMFVRMSVKRHNWKRAPLLLIGRLSEIYNDGDDDFVDSDDFDDVNHDMAVLFWCS